ncbi:MAG: mannitol dehydrogenase family protein [Prevotella sp.]|uniref:mannitol dehydrogenase family protein n=1 Tax=Prevotella sp. khp7 TaxID=1761885 RepID=UPI0008D4F0DE|nr:mannitol dehydrogenase family protein [Prevotella sp. khp7]MCR5469547.1 mannitol dehydrogenase family protein [Prevotella sp.]SEV80828.1 fructuronate reductase [Prevotella sp. khp7]
MKLNDIFSGNYDAAEWEAKGYELPKFDIKAIREKTAKEPTWVHFGGGNIFRAFPAAILNDALNTGKYDRGVIVAETFDFEVIDKAYAPYNNLSLCVNLCSDGSIEKKVIASVTEALKADPQFEDWNRLVEIFKNPSLQMISFTITEKGYSYNDADLARGLKPVFAMGKVCALLLERFNAGQLPLTVQSMDNCSHNGDKVKAGVFAYAERWVADGLVPTAFLDYLKDEKKITFPWSMIDKITPRPHEKVKEMLAADSFEDNNYIETEKHTFTAPFVNAEEVQYLVIEDNYTNGRPPLDLGGALYTTRETVDKVETMKVTTCLNPLHTAMSIYGCMLDYTLISAEMADEDLRPFIQKIGYIEAMPVVTDPGVLNPYEFIGAVINRRLPNPFMPDAPQRIACDTSQKLPIRFGETIKKYIARNLDMENLVLIPLTLAGYARYLKGLKDDLTPFEPSPDPMLAELQAIVAPLEIGKPDQDWSPLRQLYSRKDVFGLDLYEAGLGEQIEGYVRELYAGPGAVRQTLHKYVSAR